MKIRSFPSPQAFDFTGITKDIGKRFLTNLSRLTSYKNELVWLRPTKTGTSIIPRSFIHCSLIYAPINVKPERGGGLANHGNLTVAYIPRVGILIGHHAFDLSMYMVEEN